MLFVFCFRYSRGKGIVSCGKVHTEEQSQQVNVRDFNFVSFVIDHGEQRLETHAPPNACYSARLADS